MTPRLASTARIAAILLLAALLAGCASKINQDNFDRIHSGMTMKQVRNLLGKPTESSSFGVGDLSGTSATWKGRDGTITVQFFNAKVQAKQFSKP